MTSEVRYGVRRSWENALRVAEKFGHLQLTPATAAGLYLNAADDDAERALAMLPDPPEGEGQFLRWVRDYLERIVECERASRGPVLRTGTEGR